jgi:branched-chain amino acid transport system permease protein
LAGREQFLAVLLRDGFTPDTAGRLYGTLSHYVLGFAVQLCAHAEVPSVIYACGHGRNGILLAPLTGLLPSSGGAYIAKTFITVITGGAAVITGTLSCSVIFGTINQIVSFGSTPVIGEIVMLAFAVVLLRLMPQGITGRFFRNAP